MTPTGKHGKDIWSEVAKVAAQGFMWIALIILLALTGVECAK